MCCICVIYACVWVCVGQAAGQMYTYPARCWRKKRRLLAPLDPQLRLCELRLGKKEKKTFRAHGTSATYVRVHDACTRLCRAKHQASSVALAFATWPSGSG